MVYLCASVHVLFCATCLCAWVRRCVSMWLCDRVGIMLCVSRNVCGHAVSYCCVNVVVCISVTPCVNVVVSLWLCLDNAVYSGIVCVTLSLYLKCCVSVGLCVTESMCVCAVLCVLVVVIVIVCHCDCVCQCDAVCPWDCMLMRLYLSVQCVSLWLSELLLWLCVSPW